MSTTPTRSTTITRRTSGDLNALFVRYSSVRRGTESLCVPLSPEDCAVQSMENCSPAKWHLAHTSWFFETFILERAISGYVPYDDKFRVLFNSYYTSVGEQYRRPQRGFLTRPSLFQVMEYRRHVDRHLGAILDAQPTKRSHSTEDSAVDVTGLLELGIQHEQQHQELILTDIKHLFSHNPLQPVYLERPLHESIVARPLSWHRYEGGVQRIGYKGEGFSFDNEQPRHRVFVEPFELGSRPITNGEYLSFIEDCGYERPELWLSDGWYSVTQQQWSAPLYWQMDEDSWSVFTLSGLRALNLDEPVCHVSFYEADAFARWSGARLATEAEWETAASNLRSSGNFVESRLLHPAPGASSEESPAQLFGDVWEWTSSSYSPYHGFRPPAGALGEYNGKFMCNQMVLRGGSCVTPQSHIRATYRNFFPPDARWQFSGIRLARDVERS